jgi:hypothetical protein
MLAALDLTTLLVEERAHLLDQFGVLPRKVLVFVPCGVIFGMAMH